MTRLAGAIVMLLFSMGAAYAQTTEDHGCTTDKTCVYAGETYSQGATICITDIAGLTCDSQGHWTTANNLDQSHCGRLNRSDNDDNEEDHMRHQ